MKTLTRKLKPLDMESGRWLQHVINFVLKDSDGNQITYQGDAITSIPGENHSIEFEVGTSFHRPSEINLSLFVSSDTLVKLYVNGSKLEPHEYDQGSEVLKLAASDDEIPLVHDITQDITKWVEGSSQSRVKLYFFCEAAQTTVTILAGGEHPELKSTLRQKWSWRYALQSIAFFTLLFLSALGLLILAGAHSRPLGETFQYYAVITAVLTWLIAFLGVFAQVRISLLPAVRQLYSRTRNRRGLSLIAFSLLFVTVAVGVGTVGYCLRQRQRYSALIQRAMEGSPEDDDEAIRQAFILIPWRREAQILFERRAFDSRDAADMRTFRRYVIDFVTQKEIIEAVNRAENLRSLPFYLTEEESTLSDPLVWYTSLLPESDAEGEMKGLDDAIKMLSTAVSPQAAMQRMSFQLTLLTKLTDRAESEEAKSEYRRKSEEVANELKELLKQHTGKSDGASFPYQVGCDSLGTYYIRLCSSKDKGLYEEALSWFKKEVHSRNQVVTLSKNRFWHRPPDKLVLYYMLCPQCSTTGGGRKTGESFLNNYNYCYCIKNEIWKSETARCAEDWFKKQMEDYPEYQKKDAWFKNSILNQQVDSDIRNNLLGQGWRY